MALGLLLVRFDFLYRKVRKHLTREISSRHLWIPDIAEKKLFQDVCHVDSYNLNSYNHRVLQASYNFKPSNGHHKELHLH